MASYPSYYIAQGHLADRRGGGLGWGEGGVLLIYLSAHAVNLPLVTTQIAIATYYTCHQTFASSFMQMLASNNDLIL